MNKDSSDEQGIPVNATTILALLTLMGGVLLVTHKLSSDRPVAPSGEANHELSEQKIDTRLWEDPFGQSGQAERTNTVLIGNLAGEIVDSRNKDFRLLAVMIPGGPASEDREFRLRSRFAIVSALAESAYAPRQEGQIGIAKLPWPTTLELSTNISQCMKLAGQEKEACIQKLASRRDFSKPMFYAFEWYERERFLKYRPDRDTNEAPVLVLWLDEDQFSDYPIPRLDLFLRKLADKSATRSSDSVTNHSLALIGPCHSDTLKAMFARDFNPNGPPLGDDRTNWTTDVSLFLASPQAIDEVLVTNHCSDNAPRQALLKRLTHFFKSARNFAATDSDLARGVFEELKLRGVDLAEATNENHLVLIGGWDEYFGRMLSAAYAAELAGGPRDTFLDDYRHGKNPGPTNLHTFLYLSGLDGQGLSSETKESQRRDREMTGTAAEDPARDKPARWTPDENRAEGPAQYDYLGRLAGRIQKLNDQLLQEGRGRVSAIGIGGGDVYDTLLILQALRPRFPEAIFFTTELDARFWDPKEWQWSRNLVVVSGYGLELSEVFQSQTAPFRDSHQPAQFAAALAALGNTSLPTVTNNFPVQHFEIGRKGPVNLTRKEDDFQPPLHPRFNLSFGMKDWFKEEYTWFTQEQRLLAVPVTLLCGLLLALALSRNFRRLTCSRREFMAEPLWLREEDIGGLDGFMVIADGLGREPKDEHQARLGRTIESRIKLAEREMNEALQEPCASSIFSESDLLKPDDFVKALNGRDDIEDPPGFSDELRARRKRLATALRHELPPGTKILLDRLNNNAGDLSASLGKIIEDLRCVISTVDLSDAAAQGNPAALRSPARPPEEPGSILWVRNRELLRDPFHGLLRPPVSLSQLLFPAAAKQERSQEERYKEARLRRKELMDALKAPERRDCLRSAMLKVLDEWNAQWLEDFNDMPGCPPRRYAKIGEPGHPRHKIPPIKSRVDLNVLISNRDAANKRIKNWLEDSEHGKRHPEHWEIDNASGLERSAEAARSVSRELYGQNKWRWLRLMWIATPALALGIWMFLVNLYDTASWPWAITGASVWPSNWLYLLAVVLGCLFISESYFQLRTTMLETTRQCRLEYNQAQNDERSGPMGQQLSVSQWIRRMFYPSSSEPVAVVSADEAWGNYQLQGQGWYRFYRTTFFALAYFILILGIHQLAFGHQYNLFLRAPGSYWYRLLVWLGFVVFLLLSFWTIDAAFLCRWFILRISNGPTLYSLATRKHFSRQRGQVLYHVLSEWIDVSVIAEITERVGKLIYFPAALFLLIILANNNLFYSFPWPPIYYVLAACDFMVAAASIVILQRAARKARDQSLQVLQEKLNQLKAGAVITEAQKKQHDIKETEDLLNDIRSLKKGAFGGFWGNPVVGALLVPSSGTALIEILRYLVK